MRTAELTKMFELEDTYWWFAARRELVAELVRRHRPRRPNLVILDVGCGTGATLGALEQFGTVVGIDRSAAALGYCRARNQRRLVQARGEELPITSASVDVVTALDLLEHIRDDAGASAEFARVLRPGGLLVVTVPALPGLWSEHDEALDHLRRYRATRLRRVLSSAGFRIERLSPLITALLPPIAGLRLVQRALPRRSGAPQTAFILPPAPVNRMLTELLRLESRWLLRRNLPVGVSLMAVARKP